MCYFFCNAVLRLDKVLVPYRSCVFVTVTIFKCGLSTSSYVSSPSQYVIGDTAIFTFPVLLCCLFFLLMAACCLCAFPLKTKTNTFKSSASLYGHSEYTGL